MIIQRLRDLLKGGSRIVQRQRTPTQSGKLADLDRRQLVAVTMGNRQRLGVSR